MLKYDFNLKNKKKKVTIIYSYIFLMSSMMYQRYNKGDRRFSIVSLNTFEDTNAMLGKVVKVKYCIMQY
jgi:hypothetical protein